MLDRLNTLLTLMGIPGLLLISFLDSAAVPLPGGPDALVMLLGWKRPSLTFLIIVAATVGSTLGCLVLYGIGMKGGERALARFNPDKAAWIERKMQKYGLLAVVASVIAPPPFPTKMVIIAAGVLRTGKWRVGAGVLAGRLIRYSLIGYMAAHFGDRAAGLIKGHYPTVSLLLIGCILLIVLIQSLKSRAKEQ